MRYLHHLVPALCMTMISSSLSFAQETGLPGNATSLHETHGNWTVTCALTSSHDGHSICFRNQ